MNRILRRRHVDRAYHLLHCWTVGGKRCGVLILAAQVERNRPCRPRCRSPTHQVRTLSVETAEVVDESLAKMIAVVERRARDAQVTRINAVDPDLGGSGAARSEEHT